MPVDSQGPAGGQKGEALIGDSGWGINYPKYTQGIPFRSRKRLFSVRDGGHIRPYPRGHIRPYPKRGHIRPYPTILPIDCVIEPFRVRPGDKGLLGGTGEHLGGTWGRSLSHFPHY